MSVGESTFTVNAACLCHLKSVKWLFKSTKIRKERDENTRKYFLQKLVTRHISFHLPDNEVVRV